MSEDLEVLRQHAQALGLHEEESYTSRDQAALVTDLNCSEEYAWAKYVSELNRDSFQDLMERLKE